MTGPLYVLSEAEVFARPGTVLAAERIELRNDMVAHAHDFAEVALITAGEGEHFTEAGVHPLTPDTLLILGPQGWHAHRAVSELSFTNVYLTRGLLATLTASPELAAAMGPAIHHLAAPGAAAALLLQREDAARLGDLFARIAEAPERTLLGQVAIAYKLMDFLASQWATATPLAVSPLAPTHFTSEATLLPHSERTSQAISLLHARLAVPWRLDGLAAALNTSGSQLVRAFRADLGVGPMAYLQQLRAERMAYLLRTTELTVAAAGRTVGWEDPSYASRRFSAHWRLSPTDYRRLAPGPPAKELRDFSMRTSPSARAAVTRHPRRA